MEKTEFESSKHSDKIDVIVKGYTAVLVAESIHDPQLAAVATMAMLSTIAKTANMRNAGCEINDYLVTVTANGGGCDCVGCVMSRETCKKITEVVSDVSLSKEQVH